MRSVVLNLNGNVGKSTACNEVVYPRLPKGTEVIYVESDNSIPGKIAGSKEIEATSEEWAWLIEYLATNIVDHDIIVDIGSTDSKKIKALFTEFHGSVDEFDLFIVPHSPDGKSEDTALTIDFLQNMGVPAEKIKMIFNMVPVGAKLEKIFADLFAYHEEHKNFVINTSAVIYKTGLFERIKNTDNTVESINLDKTNWTQQIIDAHPKKDDPKVKEAIAYYSWMKTNKMMATSLVADFDRAFKAVMGKPLQAEATKKVSSHA